VRGPSLEGAQQAGKSYLLSEPAIVAGMARATLPNSRVDWEGMVSNYDRIRDAIESVFPIFKEFNARVRKRGGFHLTSTARNRIWETPTGKANFLVYSGLDAAQYQDDPDVLLLATIRSHDQFNTTVYALDDRYRGVFGQRRVLFLSSKASPVVFELMAMRFIAQPAGVKAQICWKSAGGMTGLTG
jgi:anaerobic selenocysteine-containing dehydrogenase